MPVEYTQGCQWFPGASSTNPEEASHCEGHRLATFSNWPLEHPCSPIKLASNGFAYCGQGDSVKCYFCGLIKDGWAKDEKPDVVHRLQSPNCPMVVGEGLEGEGERERGRRGTEGAERIEEGAAGRTGRRAAERGEVCGRRNVPIPTMMRIRNPRIRLSAPTSTAVAAPHNHYNIDDIDLSAERFKRETGVQLRCQRSVVQRIGELGAVRARQEQQQGDGGQRGYLNLHNDQHIATAMNAGWAVHPGPIRAGEAESLEPLFPNHGSVKSRRESFLYNYKVPFHLGEKIRELCEAGFFYTGLWDVVMCWYCGLMLYNWQPHDDPIHGHVNRRPSCRHFRLAQPF